MKITQTHQLVRQGIVWLGILMVIGGSGFRVAGQENPAQKEALSTVTSFFRYHLAHDMGFTSATLRRRQPWLHPELYRLLQYELTRTAQFTRRHPDDVPYFDGDPFTDSQDTPNRFHVDSVAVAGPEAAEAMVTLIWGEPSGKTLEERHIRVILKPAAGKWLINDIFDQEGKSLQTILKRKNYSG